MLCVLPMLYQAALFYIPRKIWKTCEGGLIASFGEIFQQNDFDEVHIFLKAEMQRDWSS